MITTKCKRGNYADKLVLLSITIHFSTTTLHIENMYITSQEKELLYYREKKPHISLLNASFSMLKIK